MQIFEAVFFFTLGAIIGSFLNVVILRYNTGVGLRGRSRCFSCGKDIKWYDLVPILSFLFLRGRCRHCKSKISFQYSLVEFVTGLLFLGVFLKFFSLGFFELSIIYYLLSIDLFILCLLVIIAVYDLNHKIIPDRFVFLFGLLSLVKLFLTTEFSSLIHFPGILNLLAGPILALPIFLLWLLSSGRWIGLGDAKLVLGIGWFLGFSFGVSALVVGFWIGAIVSVFLVLISKFVHNGFAGQVFLNLGVKNLTMKSEIPLGPFLILGFIVVYFSGIDVMGLGGLNI